MLQKVCNRYRSRKVQPSITAAEADNKAQTAEINTVVEKLPQRPKLSMKQNLKKSH